MLNRNLFLEIIIICYLKLFNISKTDYAEYLNLFT